ncbi:MAG: hypothetical protein ACP5QE_06360, partial [Conexivisphaera sp.]
VTITVTQPTQTYSLTFTQSGLPSGATWWAEVNGQRQNAQAGQSITFNGLSGTVNWSVANPVAYRVGGKYGQTYYYYASPSSGSASSGGTIQITYTKG